MFYKGGKLVKQFGRLGAIYQWPSGQRYFYKSVLRSKHFHRNHQSWAIACDIVKELEMQKVDYIVLEIRDEGKAVYCYFSDFLAHSIIDKFRDYEEQNFLHEKFWLNAD